MNCTRLLARAGSAVLLCCTTIDPHFAVAADLTIERMFAAPDLSGPSLRSPQLSPDGRWLTYLQGKADNKDRLDLWAYDVAQRRHQLLVDSSALANADKPLSPEEEARRERQRTASLSGIVEYSFSADSRYLLVPLGGDLYLYDLRAPATRAVRRLTDTADYETDAQFSPRGRFVSFLRAQNLYAIDLTSGREQALTRGCQGSVSCGVAEFIAQEEMGRNTGYWWAADESQVAYAQVDEAGVDEVQRFEILADSVQVIRQRYPAAGRPNATVELWVTPVVGGENTQQARALPLPSQAHYLARVNWLPDNLTLAVQVQTRDQRRLDLLFVDTASGEHRKILSETSEHWVDLHDELTFLKSTPAFVWASARSGYRHLYLYDLNGQLLRPITAGDWLIAGDADERTIRGIDEPRGLVYFMANKDSPIERHLYRAPLRGSTGVAEVEKGIARITEAAGWHSVRLSVGQQVFVDTYTNAEQPASITLRALDGRLRAAVLTNALDDTHPYAALRPQHIRTQFGTLRASDGQILHWQMLTPRLEPGRRYPVVVDVYGGPGVQRVRNAWMGGGRANEGYFRQLLAQRGYVVFTLDNRGSGFRGTRFESALHRRLGNVEVEDQVVGVEYLRSLPFVDAQRVGIFGWSYGGYMALRSLTLAPDYFQAGVAGAPVTDWALYDTHYTERFMETPQGNSAGYRGSSVLSYADRLRGRLLLVHGMADDNVLFTHATALMQRLQAGNQAFELMTYPGAKHGLLRGASTGPHAYNAILQFFERRL